MAMSGGFTQVWTKTGFAKISATRPLRAASDESRVDPFSAALRSVSCLVPALKEKNLRGYSLLRVTVLNRKLKRGIRKVRTSRYFSVDKKPKIQQKGDRCAKSQ